MTGIYVYKLTDQNMQTYNGCKWVLGEEKTTSGEGELCGPGWLHCYSDPLLAVLLNPIHADYENPRLFRAHVGGTSKPDHGLKSGYTKMTLIEEIPVPAISTAQRVRFAILCAMKVYQDPGFVQWGENWLSGKDRSAEAAAWSAGSAAWSAGSAAWSARSAAWSAAESAGSAARSAAWSARAAAEAAAWAAEAEIDLISIAHEAVDRDH